MGIANEYHVSVTPLVVFFVLCNIVGFFGNLSVLYIYSLRYPKNCHRLIVLILSALDMTACCSTVPIETVSTWYWFDVPSSSLCKARFFFIMFVGLAAMYMLFVSAIYKFQRVCKPFGKKVTRKIIITLCLVGMAISFMFGIPPLILFDVNQHNITLNNVTEKVLICEVHTSYHCTPYPAVYRHCVAVYSLLLVTAVILYACVAKTTIQYIRRRKNEQNKRECAIAESSFILSLTKSTTKTDLDSTDGKLPIPSVDKKENTIDRAAVSIQDNTLPRPKTQLSASQIRKILIMVIVAGTFAVTFLMGLAFGYVFALRKYEDYSSIGELVLLFACYRLYFLNYCMNPVVYFVLDSRFKEEIYKTFRLNPSSGRRD